MKIFLRFVNQESKYLFTFVNRTGMKCSELLRILRREGWIIYRTGKGSHKILVHPDKQGTEIVFPDHGTAEIAKGLACKILKQAGLK